MVDQGLIIEKYWLITAQSWLNDRRSNNDQLADAENQRLVFYWLGMVDQRRRERIH